jgi:hypothetical protein
LRYQHAPSAHAFKHELTCVLFITFRNDVNHLRDGRPFDVLNDLPALMAISRAFMRTAKDEHGKLHW